MRPTTQQWAQPWEIQALLRAHRVAGDEELGERFLVMIDKTRYPEGGCPAEAVQEIRRVKARVDAERLAARRGPEHPHQTGRGGLADIEGPCSCCSCATGTRSCRCTTPRPWRTLDAIGAAELVAEGDVALLRQAWLTATRARNALVLVRGKPTDQLPAGTAAQRRCGGGRLGGLATAASSWTTTCA